ncbi:transketolase [Nostoc sp. 'Lobaria pulmonaria (5183) cyanobiont']|uniref:transketolase n=1 Tax=Nostoc sp. 'Lobaria pulmonaria (5183) cyanobiont' TaxID=1618022 RepID=UPI000CF32565|nr:transketolase [Nostoc sp. 'Lobaria pulmonaria (5183) cyanobiont']AVH71710.1 transketolase [Nostoc sp. 'Lobaria pulmonaria (5183) cyanobiont']
MATLEQLQAWHELAQQLRIDSIRATTAAGSGHPTSSMSAADLMAVLLAKYLRYDFSNPHSPNNDHLIFSKGHASPLLYSIYRAAGAIDDDELMSLRKFGSRLEGHPTPALPWVDVATGSLGQGLPIAVGIALAGEYLDKLPYHTWVLLGDSEMAEGSIWEAFEHASHYKLANLIAILDVNRLGQRGETMLGWNTQTYCDRALAFGWKAIEIDGHNLEEIDEAYAAAIDNPNCPTLIVSRTKKGKGVADLEDIGGWHGKVLKPDQAKAAIKELGGERQITIAVSKPNLQIQRTSIGQIQALQLPSYQLGEKVATRKAYGDTLKALGASRPDVVALDGEVSNSTYAEEFAKAYPERYFEMYIAEQQLVAAAVGLQVRQYKPFASSFAAFLSRAYDFVRMAAISRANIKLVGSHAGISIGEDGPSQMALEDLACLRAVCGSTVLYPSDANQTAKLVAQMVDCDGIVYLRTTRESTPVLYEAEEDFSIGGSKVIYSSEQDQAAVIAAGITLHEALKAYQHLKQEGITVRIIDAYSVKPIDATTLHQAARDTQGKLVVVEDHWGEGGLGAAVLDAFVGTDAAPTSGGLPLNLIKLAVRELPGSGTPEELLHAAKIDASSIVEAVRSLVKQPAYVLTK